MGAAMAARNRLSSAMRRSHRAQSTVYLLVLCLFIGVTKAQMSWRPTRTDRPMGNFGGNFVFLTVQTNFIILAYVSICLCDYMCARKVNFLVNLVEKLTGMVFTIGFMMGALYYSLIHFHPLTRQRAEEVQNFDLYMHFLHATPLIFVVCEALFREKTSRRPVADILSVESYVLFYFSWSVFCAYKNDGWWPYAFQQQMKIWQHVAMIFVLGVFVVPLISLGGRTLLRGKAVNYIRHRKRLSQRMVRSDSKTDVIVHSCSEVIDSCVDSCVGALDTCVDALDTCTEMIDSCSDMLDSYYSRELRLASYVL